MNVLSLFDGTSAGRLSLERAGIEITNYYASEVDKDAIAVSKRNYPDIIQLGDVNGWREWELPEIDLIIGGSPCQGFSKAGKMLNFEDPRSKLFFVFVDVIQALKPEYFFLENVAMKAEYRDIITQYMGVEPRNINSRLVTAQNRDRYYWSNIPFGQPEDKGITLADVLDQEVPEQYLLKHDYFDKSEYHGIKPHPFIDSETRKVVWRIPEATKKGYVDVYDGQCVDLTFISSKTRRGRTMAEKSNCMTAANFVFARAENGWFRRFTPEECERLQNMPDGYTAGVSDAARYKMLGNGWTVDVIAHIFQGMKKPALISV